MKQWFLVLLSFIFSSAFFTANAQQGTAEWSRRAGSNGTDQANGVVTDNSGNVYVTGSFSGSGADFGNGIFRNSSGAEDVFLAKYNASGTTQWVNIAGASGTNLDRGRAVAVDNMGNVVVAGFIEGSANFANTTLTSGGLRDAFVAKYDVNGGLLWAKKMGGVGRDEAYDVATDASGNVYVTGLFQNSVTIGATTLTSKGDFDAFTAKLDANGNPVWATRAGGEQSDQAWSLSVDGNNVYVTGYFDGIAQFDGANGILERTTAGGFDMFVSSLDASTGKVAWINTGGGTSSDYGHKVLAERGTGASYVTGRYAGAATFSGANGTKATLISTNSSDDVYLVKYNAAGELVWARSAGGTLSDFGNSLAIDNAGSVYVAGQYQNSFNWLNGVDPAFALASKGNYDIFVARYDANGNANFVKGFGTSSLDVATGINLFGGSAYLTGYYTGTIKFDNNAQMSSPGLTDVFVAKLGFDVQPCNLTTPTITAGAAANCQQTLTVNGAGNVSAFNWFRNGVQINGQSSINLVAVEAGVYTVQSVSGGCLSIVSQGLNVSISNNLNLNVSASPVSVTAGQASTLSVNVTGNSGNLTIVWRDGNGNVIGNNATVTVNPTVSTSYTVEVADNNGCRRTGSVTVSVLGTGNCRTEGDVVISITPGNDNVTSTTGIAEICEGQSTGLQAAAFLGNTQYGYLWIRESANGDIIVKKGTPSVESIVTDVILNSSNAAEVAQKTVRYRLILSEPGCLDVRSNPIDVRTFKVPTVTVSSNQTGVCATGNAILSASATGGTPYTVGGTDIEGGYKYRWEPANAVVGSNTTRVVTVIPSIATTFTVTAEDANTCGQRTQVNVNPAIPQIQLSPIGPITACVGDIVSLSATLIGNPTANQEIRWILNGIPQPTFTGSSSINVTTAGTWVAQIYDRSNNCNNLSNSVSVSFASRVLANAGNNSTICRGNSTIIGGANPVNGVVYSWSPTDGLTNPFIARPVARPNFTTTYTLVATNPAAPANCNSTTSTVTVTVEEPGVMPMIMTNDPTSICKVGSVTFMISNPVNGVSYTWFVNGNQRSNGNTFTLTNEGGSVSARANVGGTGICNNPFSNEITVTVFDGADLMVPKIQPFGSATLAICNNQSVRMFTERMEGLSYQWWMNGEVIPGANDTTFTAMRKGIYHVQVFAGDVTVNSQLCSKKSEGLFITESNVAPVTVMSEGDRTVCPESNVCLKFHATTGHPSKKITWMWMPKTGTDKVVESMENGMSYLELCVKPLVSTTYTVWAKDDFGCMSETMATVNISSVGEPSINSVPETCFGSKITLTGNGNGGSFYRWLKREVQNSSQAGNMSTPVWNEVKTTSTKLFNDTLGVVVSVLATSKLGASAGYPREQYILETSVPGCGITKSKPVDVIAFAPPTVSSVSAATRIRCSSTRGNITLTANVQSGSLSTIESVTWKSLHGTSVTDFTNTPNQANTSSTSVVRVDPSVTDTFIVTVKNSNGCESSSSVAVTVVGSYTASFSGAAAGCSTPGVRLTIANHNRAYSIQWQRQINANSAFQNITNATDTSYLVTETATYRVRCINNTCSTESFSAEQLVSISASPTLVGASAACVRTLFNQSNNTETYAQAVSLCYGEPIKLRFINGRSQNSAVGSVSPGSYTYTWYYQSSKKDSPMNVIVSGDLADINTVIIEPGNFAYPDTSATYSYIFEAKNINAPNCVVTSTSTATLVKKGPIAEAVADKPMVCEGTKVMLMGKNTGELSSQMANASSLPSAYRYVYYRWNGPVTMGNPTGLMASGILEQNGSAVTPNPTNRDIAPLAVTPLKTTTYTLTLSTPLNECVATCEVTVWVGPKLVATVMNVTENENLCEGPVNLRAICNSSNPGIMYQWYTDVTGMDQWTPVPGATSADFMPTTGGNYNVKVWLPGMEACYDYADRFQTISGVKNDGEANDLVTVMKNGDWMVQDMPAVICAGQEIDLQARYIFGAAYQWYKVTGPKNMPTYVILDGKSERTLRVSQPGNYKVNVIAGCFSCPGSCETWSQTCPVVVMPELKPTVLHNGHIELCEGSHVELYTQGKTSQYNYQWYYSAGYNDTYVEMAGQTEPRLITKAEGRYKVRVGSIFTPVSNDPSKLCHAMSTNFVDVKSCVKDYCPKPISVRGILNQKDGCSVVIAWDQPLNSSQYNITGNYRLTYGVKGSPANTWVTTTVMGKTWFQATGLSLNTNYDVMVVTLCDGVDKESEPEYGMFKTFQFGTCNGNTDVCPDLNQTNAVRFDADGTTTTSIRVLWDQVADAANNLIGYRVEYTAQNSNNTLFVEVLKTSLVEGQDGSVSISGLTPNTVYTVCVRPYCADGPKERIICETVSTLDSPVADCARSMAVWVIGVSPNDARIGWMPVAGATSYIVRRSGAADLNVVGTDVVLENLDPSTTYNVSVEPVITNCTAISDGLTVTTLASGSPASRAQLGTVSAGGCSNNNQNHIISITWPENSANVSEYRISLQQVGSSTVINYDPLDGTQTGFDIEDSNLANGLGYIITVTSVFIDGEQTTLNVVAFTGTCGNGRVASTTTNTTTYNIYPNPTKGEFSVAFDAKEAGNVSFKLLDATGRVVYTNTVDAVSGANVLPINANLSGGIYMLQIQNGDSIHTAKIVVE